MLSRIVAHYYPDVGMDGMGTLNVNPCPKCGHNDCCKIFAADEAGENIACFSESCFGMDLIQAMMWLFDLSHEEALGKLKEDFDYELTGEELERVREMQKLRRFRHILTTYADKCTQAMGQGDYAYWQGRGFSEAFIKQRKIGRAHSGSYDAMLAEGFSPEELAWTRLFNMIGNEYFNGCYTLPNLTAQGVIDIQGRRIDNASTRPKYMLLPGEREYLFNLDALSAGNTIYVCEGIPDTLSLIQQGLPALGVYGVGGLKEHFLPLLARKNCVYLCFDRDDAGQKAAAALADRIGPHARIVELEGAKDVNEFFCSHPKDALQRFEQLVSSAMTPLEKRIAGLPNNPAQAEQSLRELVPSLRGLSPIAREYYMDLLMQKLNVNKKVLRETMEHLRSRLPPPDEGDIFMGNDPEIYKLCQCFVDGKAYFAQDFLCDKGEGISVYRTKIISSERKLLDAPAAGSDDNGIVFWKDADTTVAVRRALPASTRRWSKTGTPWAIDRFLAGKEEQINAAALYRETEAMFRRYYYTAEETDYIYLSLFVLFSYYFELYDALPYLYINGPAGSGKSTLCLLMESLCFNGALVSNISTAALFREAERLQTTLILDEQEDLTSRKGDNNSDFLSILKSAYKRTGTIKRQRISNFEQTEEFSIYNPIIIANVLGLESILKTRTVHITTQYAPAQKAEEIMPLRPTDAAFREETQRLRDKLYCWVMQRHVELARLPKISVSQHAQNRDAEIFQPFLALAGYVEAQDPGGGTRLTESLLGSLESKKLKRNSYAYREPTALMKEAVLEVLKNKKVERGGATWITVHEILDSLVEVAGGYESYMKPSYIGDRMVSNGWIQSDSDKKRVVVKDIRRNVSTNLKENTTELTDRKVTAYYVRYDLVGE